MHAWNDPVIDELQNNQGEVFIGRAPAQGWIKPERVTLRAVNSLLVGIYGGPPNMERPELEFLLYTARTPRRRIAHVKPSGQILEKFLKLASASNEEICKFASKFGPLLIFCRRERVEQTDVEIRQLLIVERCEVWAIFRRLHEIPVTHSRQVSYWPHP